MANLAAIRSVGTSLTAYLTNAYRDAEFPPDVPKPACTFSVISIGGVTATSVPTPNNSVQVLVFLYRASINHHLRNVGRFPDQGTTPVPLSVDLRYLLSFWSSSSENEQLVLAWTMRQLHQVPVLDASILSADASWAADDVIQLIPEEISTEDLMRVWDAIEPAYRLSLSYIARVVRIDPDQTTAHRPVVATRVNYAVPAQS